MNRVAVHLKQKKQTRYNTVSHVYTNTNYRKRMRLYSLQALVTWAATTYLKPGQAWVPWMHCLGTEGGGKEVPANEPCPVDPACLFPSAPAHNLQIQAAPPAGKLHLLHPKDVEPPGWKSFGKPPGLHVSR